jgi:Domain of unknown function (DUF4367)
MVEMSFDRFQLDPSFDKDAFDMERNLNSLPEDTKQTFAPKKSKTEREQLAVTPEYYPAGSQLISERTVQTPQGQVVIMRYSGKHPFTLTQKQPIAMELHTSSKGKPIFLNGSVGVLFHTTEQKRFVWTDGQTEFELNGDLPEEEIIEIANSMMNQPLK